METEIPLNGRRLSFELTRLRDLCCHEKISLFALITNMTSRSHALLSLFFALPFLLPVPLPGLSVLFGFGIVLSGLAMAFGKKPWLPKRFLNREVKGYLFAKIFNQGVRISRKLERFVKPRGTFFVRHPGMRSLNGGILAFCGFLLALPLPPGTNFPPALAIILLSIGSLEEDILFMGLGYLLYIINMVIFGGIVFFGVNGIKTLSNSF